MIPGLQPSGDRRDIQVCFRLTAAEVAAIEAIAAAEGLHNRDGTPNRTAVMQLALALYIRGHRDGPYTGWRPENGTILPSS